MSGKQDWPTNTFELRYILLGPKIRIDWKPENKCEINQAPPRPITGLMGSGSIFVARSEVGLGDVRNEVQNKRR